VGNLAEKYGKGKKSTVKCKTCSYEQAIFSSGVHTSDGGAVMVYDTNEEFVCPNCGIDGDIEEIDEENGNNGPTTGN
jgi:ribosomal protein S27E